MKTSISMFVALMFVLIALPSVAWAQEDAEEGATVYTGGPPKPKYSPKELCDEVAGEWTSHRLIARKTCSEENDPNQKPDPKNPPKMWVFIGEAPWFPIIQRFKLAPPDTADSLAGLIKFPPEAEMMKLDKGLATALKSWKDQDKAGENILPPSAEPMKKTGELQFDWATCLGTTLSGIRRDPLDNGDYAKIQPTSCLIKVTIRGVDNKTAVMDVALATLEDVGGQSFLVSTYGLSEKGASQFAPNSPIIVNHPLQREGLVDTFIITKDGQQVRQAEGTKSNAPGKPLSWSKLDWNKRAFLGAVGIAGLSWVWAILSIARFRRKKKASKSVIGIAIAVGLTISLTLFFLDSGALTGMAPFLGFAAGFTANALNKGRRRQPATP